MPVHYPFSAIVGCDADELDPMGLALILTTLDPDIGGVLIRGEKGTAKSTAVRALTDVLPPIEVYRDDRFSIDPNDATAASPDGPFAADADRMTRPVHLVELPIGATEDRVLGSLQLENALSHGSVEFEPGLLARAHRGVLYVDEINLMHDHLVDVLLDSAAMGRVTVERDGLSVEHASRFALIGTMNPEEGELRPQLLDRFGLTVEVAAPRDAARRAEVVRRRMSYDSDPQGFRARYRDSDRRAADRLSAARSRLAHVVVTDRALLKVAEVCAAFDVDGLRADIVTTRAAVAHAAWHGRRHVTRADIRQAALLALPHRRRRNPFDAPGIDEELLDEILGDDEPPEPPDDGEPSSTDDGDGPPEGAHEPGDAASGADASDDDPGAGEAGDHAEAHRSDAPGPPGGASEDHSAHPAAEDSSHPDGSADGDAPTSAESTPRAPGGSPAATAGQVVSAGAPYRPRLFTVDGLGSGVDGRRSRARSTIGYRVGARAGAHGSLHVVETLMAAASHQSARRQSSGSPASGRVLLRPDDLRVAVREGRESNLILFCVDASGSMAAKKRMTQVKTAILSLLLDAYRRRDKVGLVAFHGRGAELVLPPTRSVDIAAARLEQLPAGGRTPLADGLLEAGRVLVRERTHSPRMRPLLVVVTDGRATDGRDAVARSLDAATHLASLSVTSIVIDGESGRLRLGLAATLADRLGAEYLPVAEVDAEQLTSSVQRHTSPTQHRAA